MSQRPSTLASRTVAMLLLAVVVSLVVAPSTLVANDKKRAAEAPSFMLRAPMPLGVEAFQDLPSKRNFYLYASVENPALDGVRVVRSREGSVTRSDGTPLTSYPEVLDFRVTASAFEQELSGVQAEAVECRKDMNEFLLGLKFRLKIYRGLHMQIIKPKNIATIGVPADLPYDERVYRVSFDTHNIPVDARIVLEVMSPEGNRLSRFHLELL